jgi:hypothetical protein
MRREAFFQDFKLTPGEHWSRPVQKADLRGGPDLRLTLKAFQMASVVEVHRTEALAWKEGFSETKPMVAGPSG